MLGDLELEVWHVPPDAVGSGGSVGEPVPFEEAVGQPYAAYAVGEAWGPAWATSWFRITGEVPVDAANPEL